MPSSAQYDDLWPGGPRFARSGAGFALGTDSVLLADFAADRRVRRFADLGCGAGVLTVLLLHALPQAAAVGVELQPDAAQLCRDNLSANGLAGRAEILCADLREHRAVLPAGGFDLVVANPPYFAQGRGYTSPDPVRAHARDERTCTMQDICTAMAYLTRWGGSAALVHRPERLSAHGRRAGAQAPAHRGAHGGRCAQPRAARGAPRRKAGTPDPAAAGPVRARRHGLGRDPQNLSQEDVTMSGTLYLVGTPIGNLGDLSVRALETLRSADFIAAEDTRVTAKLLNHFEIKKPCVSYYEHNKYASGEKIVARLLAGETCALVTDAGMPAISDPGEDIVRQCAEQGIDVQVIPGPCAAIAALAVSGLPTQQFCFEGFLAVSGKTRREHLERLRGETRTMIFYEAPHKLLRTLCDLRDTFGGAREITLARELTKLHEQKLRTTLDGAVAYFTETPPKGEFVLVLRGAPERSEPAVTAEQALEIVARYRSEGRALKEACKLAAADTGFGKNELYQMALNA